MTTIVSTDQSRNVKMVFRKGEGRPITFQFLVGRHDHDISELEFLFQVFEIDGTIPIFELTEGDGLTNEGATGVLLLDPNDDDVDIDEKSYEYKLKITSPYTKTLFNSLFVVNNSPPQAFMGSDSATIELSLGDSIVEVNVTLAEGGSTDLSNLDYDQVISLYVTMLPLTGAQTLYTSLLPYFGGDTTSNDVLTQLYETILPFIQGEPDDDSDEYYIYTQLLPYIN